MDAQLMRSVLITPATSERILQRAAEVAADQVLIDLEDSIHPDDKPAARQRAITAICGLPWVSRAVGVRINSLDGPWGVRDLHDLVDACGDRLSAVLVPKARAGDAELVARVARGLRGEDSAGGPAIHLLVEDATAFAQLAKLAAATEVAAVFFGSGDFAASMGDYSSLVPGRPSASGAGDFSIVRAVVAVVAKAFAKLAIDTPVENYRDLDAFADNVRWSRAAGFDGRLCIHPAQVPICNELYGPSRAEFDAARSVLDAFATSDTAVFSMGDLMVDEATRRIAERAFVAGRVSGME